MESDGERLRGGLQPNRVALQDGDVSQEEKKNTGPSLNEREILAELRKNPYATMESVAKCAGLTTNVVTKTIANMKNKGWVDDGYRIAPAVLGFTERFRVNISVNATNLREGKGSRPKDLDAHTKERLLVQTQQGLAKYIIETLSRDKDFASSILVEEVSVLLGGASDISATVWARNNESMLRFVTYGLRMAEGVQSTSTVLEHWSCPIRRV